MASSSCAAKAERVHPHGRGEHANRRSNRKAHSGSSPRAWGTYRWQRCRWRSRRFIPTGVGNMNFSGNCKAGPTVHPHGRGEHAALPAVVQDTGGSSPRAWGTSSCSGGFVCCVRFIPTGVGNIGNAIVPQVAAAVHPHGRGEHYRDRRRAALCLGSSPRAWGTSVQRCGIWPRRRFIPTGVGNIAGAQGCFPRAPVHPHGRGEHRFGVSRDGSRTGSSPRAWGTW